MRQLFWCVLVVLYIPMSRLSGALFWFDLWTTPLGISIHLKLLKTSRRKIFKFSVFLMGMTYRGELGCCLGTIFLHGPI